MTETVETYEHRGETRERYPAGKGDRLPEHLPLARGWDWYQFSNGIYSTRWITNGLIFRCTHCGMESPSRYVIRRHNGLV